MKWELSLAASKMGEPWSEEALLDEAPALWAVVASAAQRGLQSSPHPLAVESLAGKSLLRL